MRKGALLDAIDDFVRAATIDEDGIGYILVILDADDDKVGVKSNIKQSALSRIFRDLSIQSGTKQ